MTKRIPAQCFHPGEFVKDEMEERGWTVSELTERMRGNGVVPDSVAANLIECKQDVTVGIAFGLHRAFGTSADFWMNLQKAFDSWKESQPYHYVGDKKGE